MRDFGPASRGMRRPVEDKDSVQYRTYGLPSRAFLVMKKLQLASSGRLTTCLGFGCAHLIGTISWRDSLRILETAYDAGVRHFDVAPMYGFGEAERCLGRFLAKRRNDVTVATKYGIPRGKPQRLFRITHALAKPVVRRLRPRKPTVESLPAQLAQTFRIPPLSVKEADEALSASLSALRTDHVDLWLLHEVTAEDLDNEMLLRFMEEAVRSGKVGSFGVGSDVAKMEAMVARHPRYCTVVQHQWCLHDQALGLTPWFRIHHGAFNYRPDHLRARLGDDPDRLSDWSRAVGQDLADARIVSQLALKGSLVMNPQSIILFSSGRPQHVLANCAVADDVRLDASAVRLFELIHNDDAPET